MEQPLGHETTFGTHASRVSRMRELDTRLAQADLAYSELVQRSRIFYPFKIGLRRHKNATNVYLRWRALTGDRRYLKCDSPNFESLVNAMTAHQRELLVDIESARALADLNYSILQYEKARIVEANSKIRIAKSLRQVN